MDITIRVVQSVRQEEFVRHAMGLKKEQIKYIIVRITLGIRRMNIARRAINGQALIRIVHHHARFAMAADTWNKIQYNKRIGLWKLKSAALFHLARFLRL